MAVRLWQIMTVAGAAMLLGLAGCSGVTGTARDSDETSSNGAQPGLAQVPLTITAGSQVHRFTVEVAASPEQQDRGLMFRTSMAPNAGMIFPFNPPRHASFWMKNTLIPLDMLFIRADGSIDRIAENTVPHSLEPVGSGGDVIAVLELAGGTAARLGLTESAIVRWQGDHIVRR